jgi:hypothetical protein
VAPVDAKLDSVAVQDTGIATIIFELRTEEHSQWMIRLTS